MSKSTGNFMTLVDAVDKFSADGEFDYKQMQGLNFQFWLPQINASSSNFNSHVHNSTLTCFKN